MSDAKLHTYSLGAAGLNSYAAATLCSQAVTLSRAGNHVEAEKLHLRALNMRVECLGLDAEETAVSRNLLGEEQLALGKLDEAEATIREALRVRDICGTPFDTAVSRENLAQVFEARGQWDAAGEIRRSKLDQMTCASYTVSDSKMKYSAHRLIS